MISATEVKVTTSSQRMLPLSSITEESAAAESVKLPGGARVFKAAENSAEFFDHMRAHYRKTRRTSVEIECELKVTLMTGVLVDTGTAIVRNVSPSGALIGSIKLANGSLPLQPFRISLSLKGEQYKGINIETTPVRLAPEVGGLGVKFEEIFVTV